MWRWAVAVGIAAAIAVGMMVTMRSAERPATPQPPPDPPGRVSVKIEPVPTPAPTPAPAPVPAPAPPKPEDTVAEQLKSLAAGDLETFRRTFLATISPSPEDFAACQTRVKQVPVRPDWEMAETATDDHGRPVRRVSMFGKSMTGFHQQPDGRWLADAIWCLPVGLP